MTILRVVYKYVVYFGVDNTRKDIALRTITLQHAETQRDNLIYLGFKNAYIRKIKYVQTYSS